jgi:hypothetical protein
MNSCYKGDKVFEFEISIDYIGRGERNGYKEAFLCTFMSYPFMTNMRAGRNKVCAEKRREEGSHASIGLC